MSDEITGKNYQLLYFKDQYSNDTKFMGNQYNKLQQDLETCTMEVNYQDYGPLEVTFKTQDGEIYDTISMPQVY